MSLTTNPNFNEYVQRIVYILQKSALLFPRTVGGDQNKQDLVNAIIPYEIPDVLNPTGKSYPHVVVTQSKTPILTRSQVGRDSRDAQGPEYLELEFYLIVIAKSTGLVKTEQQIYNIVSALTTTLDRNRRLVNPDDSTNPLSATSTWINLPYLLETDQRELIARNIVFRPKVYVNLRES